MALENNDDGKNRKSKSVSNRKNCCLSLMLALVVFVLYALLDEFGFGWQMGGGNGSVNMAGDGGVKLHMSALDSLQEEIIKEKEDDVYSVSTNKTTTEDETKDTKVKISEVEKIKDTNKEEDTNEDDEKKVKNNEKETNDDAEELNNEKEEMKEEKENDKDEEMIKKWGHWKFYDGSKDRRPTEDYCAKYPNRDIPEDDFPDDSWQVDAVYVNHFLDEATHLLTRAKEAIYAEYGWAQPLPADALVLRNKMFEWDMLDIDKGDKPPRFVNNGGWTTRKSFDGLVRRLLHAMMTNDDFTVVLGGHSAAAGHGNHFLQSYTMQFHKLMFPIFKRLGVKLITRNLAQGGLGTFQSALGSRSIYGDNIDLLLWDSSMTEKYHPAMDLFARQALLSDRPPIIWGGLWNSLKSLYTHTDADIGFYGTGLAGIQPTTNETQVFDLPYASQYLLCDPSRAGLCTAPENRFRTKCWIPRDDVTPVTPQRKYADSQVGWHPGFRNHLLMGRVLSMAILDGLEKAVSLWSEMTIMQGHPLTDEYWHVTAHYDNIRNKTEALRLDPSEDMCEVYGKRGLPERICWTRLFGRTEFTPRANPEETGILGMVKPLKDGNKLENALGMLYEGPDVENPALLLPEGAVDAVAIVSNRRRRELKMEVAKDDVQGRLLTDGGEEKNTEADEENELQTGLGWWVDVWPGNCDGSSTGICGRLPSSDCLLLGHMDYRGGILGTSYSDWLVFTVPKVTKGLILIKIDKHKIPPNPKTRGWKTINNERRRRRRQLRHLQEPPDPRVNEVCSQFRFDYAINGSVTTLDATEFMAKLKPMAHAVEIMTLLDDEDMTEEKDFEIAIRFRGCGNATPMKLTHVYWA